jgi:hypothetical protein
VSYEECACICASGLRLCVSGWLICTDQQG